MDEVREFEILFKSNHARLCSRVYAILKDQEAASDIVQNVFLKYWTNRHSILIHTSKEAYLFQACINEAANFIKSKNRRFDFNQFLGLTAALPTNHTEEEVLFNETRSRIQEAIRNMPVGCQKVFLLSRFDGKSHEEISQYLGISVNTVNNHIKKALQIVRDHILIISISLAWVA